MIEAQIAKLYSTNNKLTFLLGAANSLIFQLKDYLNDIQKTQHDWLNQAIENVIYKDEPLPKIEN